MKFNRSAAVANREKLIGRIAGPGKKLIGVDVYILPARGDETTVRGREVLEEWLLRKECVNVL